jgi:hypothetical protein
MIILDIPEFFHSPSPHIYPPFKNGLYLEEYFYQYFKNNLDKFTNINLVYIPVFWTNLQVSPHFESKKEYYNIYLKELYNQLPPNTRFFTVVQYDDSVILSIPKNTLIFGACSGHVPLPLIYEDKNKILENSNKNYNGIKNILCSFVGALTHDVRNKVIIQYSNNNKFFIYTKPWEVSMDENTRNNFINITLQSEFTLCPRGYGRSSFRFFESIILESIPIYIYNDINWLPYQDIIDYSKFSIVIHESQISQLESIIIEKLKIKDIMLQELRNHKHYFTLDFMCEYIVQYLSNNSINPPLYKGLQELSLI